MDEFEAKIRDAINQHLPDVMSTVISMVNNQRPSASMDVQPPGLRDSERLNELGNYRNVNSDTKSSCGNVSVNMGSTK